MKLNTGILARIVLLAAFPHLTAVLAGETPAELPVILKVQGDITVDGRLDESDWQRATPVPVHFIYPKQGDVVEHPRMTARFLWDDYFLYIGYEVFSTNLVVRGTGLFSGPAHNRREGCEIWVDPPATQVDLAEFFILFDNVNFFWEIHHNAANHFNDVLCIVDLPVWKQSKPAIASANIYFAKHEFIEDHGDSTLASAVTLKPRTDGQPSTINDETDTDAGYSGELRIPWYGIGAPSKAQTTIQVPAEGGQPGQRKPGPWKMSGREIAILAVSQDGGADHRYTTSASGLKPTFFHLNTGQYPRYRLLDSE